MAKVAFWPTVTVWLAGGCVVITGKAGAGMRLLSTCTGVPWSVVVPLPN